MKPFGPWSDNSGQFLTALLMLFGAPLIAAALGLYFGGNP